MEAKKVVQHLRISQENYKQILVISKNLSYAQNNSPEKALYNPKSLKTFTDAV